MRVHDLLLHAAREAPERTALEFQGNAIPYAALAEEARRVAAGLGELGLRPGDSIGLMLPNMPQFATTLFGAFLGGHVIVPMNVLLTPPEIRYLVEDSRIRLLVVFDAFLPQVESAVKEVRDPPGIVAVGGGAHAHVPYADLAGHEPIREPFASDAQTHALTIYTSGTTGKPKGAVISAGNILAQIRLMNELFRPAPDDKYLCVLPLFHAFALNGILLPCVANQTPVLLHPRFDVDAAFQALAHEDVTWFGGVPTMYFYLLKHPQAETTRFPKLRVCITGGQAMPVEVLKQFEACFGTPIYEGYGMTETTVSVCINQPGGERRVGTVGKPYPGCQMKVVDEAGHELPPGVDGEIVVRGPNIMQGYLNKPEASAETLRDGWLHTGDIGHCDEDGFFTIVDRKKDMIIKGGYNIYPREIEEVIYQLPQVAEAAVVGTRDPAKGERVRAVVALKPGQSLDERELRAHVERNLAKYKHPADYRFVAELPKGATGKILKREIRTELERGEGSA